MAKRKYPLGCHKCKNRDVCRYIKLNDVARCSINRQNLIRYGYRKRLD